MIHILDKSKCCGCSACVSACPRQCISMNEDEEGFLYPEVDKACCSDCGLCEKVCPVINQALPISTKTVYAAFNKDDKTRQLSSSGGIFSLLAQKTLETGGVIFGAQFDKDFSVIHGFTNTLEGLNTIRGSKYLQSSMLDNFSKAKQFLDDGRNVLFSGTPCQIAGLNRFLRKQYPNLTTIDCVCHGVPSPSVWKSYLSETGIQPIKVLFRDKQSGWKNYQVTIIGKNQKNQSDVFWTNPYMQVFLSNLSLRPSCYNCPSKGGRSRSDITLGDFWGIEHIDPEFDNNKGISLVLINTPKGKAHFNELELDSKERCYEEALKYNPSIAVSSPKPDARVKFFKVFIHSGFNAAYKVTMTPSLSLKIINRVKSIAARTFGEKCKKIVRILREK